tara:strand:+ start:412 stop:681 length:270 start_codon:yes stop_codon:yes gene_type:complete
MNNKIQNKTDELLVITAEEAGELTQACTKILRHGISKQKVDALIEEVGDMQCMITLLVEHNIITQSDVEKRSVVKLKKLKKYSNIWQKK